MRHALWALLVFAACSNDSGPAADYYLDEATKLRLEVSDLTEELQSAQARIEDLEEAIEEAELYASGAEQSARNAEYAVIDRLLDDAVTLPPEVGPVHC